MQNTELKIGGMSCANCVAHVNKVLQSVPGVQNVDVQLEKGLAFVQHKHADVQVLLTAVDEVGYEAELAGRN